MMKEFPIKNDAACLYKWTWSTLFLNRGTTASCHRGFHWKLDADTLKDFHNHPGKIGDREKMQQGIWPGNGCEYCRDVEVAGGASDRTSFVNKSIELLPPELETDLTATRITPRLLEVYFSNVCNQSCVYCSPGFSSQIEQEVRRFGKSEYNYDYSNFAADDRENYGTYVKLFWEWMHENAHNLLVLNTLGGEPLYQKEFEQHIEFFSTHYNPNLVWKIFTNLNHDPQGFKDKLTKVQTLVAEGRIKRLDLTVSIDCWGPELEYARTGLDLKQAEENIMTLLHTDGVGAQFHATLTAVTLPTFYQLVERFVEWHKIKPEANINWNTVVTPRCFDPYNFGSHLIPYVAKAIDVLKPYGDKYKTEQDTLNGIIKKMESTPVRVEGVNNLYGFLNDLDRRRNQDWKSIFPQIAEMVNTINGDAHV